MSELRKQLIDQPLHVLMCAASVLALAIAFQLSGDGIAASTFAGVSLTALWVGLREWHQWPSSRWWDPPMDWAFEAVGMALGAWLYVAHVGPALAS